MINGGYSGDKVMDLLKDEIESTLKGTVKVIFYIFPIKVNYLNILFTKINLIFLTGIFTCTVEVSWTWC